MKDDLKYQLDEVTLQAKKMANRYLLRKITILCVGMAGVLISLQMMSPLPCTVTLLLIVFILRQFGLRVQKHTQDALYVGCDPYLQFAFMEALEKQVFGKSRKARETSMVSKAQCMVLAGEPQEAISILHQIKDMERLIVPVRAVCYNLLLRAYGQYGWDEKRTELVKRIEEEMAELPSSSRIYLQVILQLEELTEAQEAGNVEQILEYYGENEGTLMFQKVSAQFAIADAMLRAGRTEEAGEYIDFVRENGNKLYYIRELEAQLAKADETNS